MYHHKVFNGLMTSILKCTHPHGKQMFSSSSSSLSVFSRTSSAIRSSVAGQQHPWSSNLQLATRTPIALSVRHMAKPNTRRPKVPHKTRAVVLALTKETYKYPLEGLPPTETCINSVKSLYAEQKKHNRLEQIMGKEFLEMVEKAPVVLVIHKHSCNSANLFEMEVQLHRNNMKYLFHNNIMVRHGFTGTKYETLLHLYQSQTATVLCFDKDFTKMLRLERKQPYMTILAGVVEGRILSVTQLKELAAMPALPLLHATLVHNLSAHQQVLRRNLQYNQSELSGNLARHAEGQTEDS